MITLTLVALLMVIALTVAPAVCVALSLQMFRRSDVQREIEDDELKRLSLLQLTLSEVR
jgi:hypothetical protein